MKNYRFSQRRFFFLFFFAMGDTIKEIMPSYWPRRAGSKNVLFDLEKSISEFDLRSGQVKVRSRSGHERSMSMCLSSEAT